MNNHRAILVCALALLLASASAFAQTAQITGLVSDPAGAVIPGVEIAVTNIDTGVVNTSMSNDAGLFLVPLLNPGMYSLSARKDGFKTLNRANIKLEVSQIARIDLRLEIGSLSEKMTVVAEAPLLKSETATISNIISSSRIVDLPMNGRNAVGLATLVPGALSRGYDTQNGTQNLSVNGGRNSKTVYMIDGSIATSQYFDGALLTPSPDAIEEVSVQTNSFSAEYGQGAAVINMTLKSGANQPHGSAFEFLRNDKLDARPYFASKKTALRQNQFGAFLGGPVVLPKLYSGKDRTFFFASYEGWRSRRPNVASSTVPTPAMRRGDYSGVSKIIKDPLTNQPFAGNVIPESRISPVLRYFDQFYPAPNVGATTYTYVAPRALSEERFDVRIDHRIALNDSLTVSYGINESLDKQPGGMPANGGYTNDLRKQRVMVNENHTFSPTTINELRLSYLRGRSAKNPQGLGTNHTVLSGIGGLDEQSAETPGFPGLEPANYLRFNWNGWQPLHYRDNKYEIIDNLTRVSGRHTFKTGVDLRRFDTATVNGGHSRGRFQFNGQYTNDSFADALLGLPNWGMRSFPRNEFGIHYIYNQQFFVQDDWKVTNRVTLNLGLRYELNHQPAVLHNQIASTDMILGKIIVGSDGSGNMNLNGQQVAKYLAPLYKDLIVPASSVGRDRTLKTLDRNNFGPRFGIAWRPWGDTVVVRSAYGVFYGLQQGNRLESTGIINPPFLADESKSNSATNPDTLATFFKPAAGGLNVGRLMFFTIDPDMRDPYIQQWNVAIQKTVHGVLSLEGAYVGNKSAKLEFTRPINVPLPSASTDVEGRRPWQRFTGGYYIENSGYSNYNAFQGTARVRGWRGLDFLASYAWSKAIDNLSYDTQDYNNIDPWNHRNSKGPADFDIRHRFVFSGTYALPFARNGKGIAPMLVKNWALSTVIQAQSGAPFTPSLANEVANTGLRFTRPDRIGNGNVENRTNQKDFDFSAFKAPTEPRYGNSGRNILNQRAWKAWDLTVLRNFKASERAQVQFRVDFFNFTNTPAFSSPVANLAAGNVGQVMSVQNDPRDIQLGLRVSF